VTHLGLGIDEAWGLTMPEFMILADMKSRSARRAAGVPEPVTQEEVEALSAGQKARGIIDEKGLVRNGR
jgi:hypothetical protein